MATRAVHSVPTAFFDGRFTLVLLGFWIAFSCSRWFGITGVGGLPDLTIERICLALLVGYAITTFAMQKQPFGRILPAEVGLWIFTIASAVSGYVQGAFRGIDPGEAFNTLTDSRLYPAIVFMIVLRTRTTDRDLMRLGAILTLFAIYLGLTAIAEKSGLKWALFPPAIGDFSQGIHVGRARGPYLNSAFNGTVMAQLLPIVLLLSELGSRAWRVLAYITVGLLCLGVYLTDTRACLLSLVVITAVGSVLSGPSRRAYRVLFGLLLFGAVAQNAVGGPVVPRMDQEEPINVRLNLLLATGEIVMAHPITGTGFRMFGKVNEEYYQAGAAFGEQAYQDKFFRASSHNTLLTPIAELGLFVGGLYLILLCRAVANGLHAPVGRTVEERASTRRLLICSLLVGIGYLVNGIAVEFQSALTPNALFWVFAAFSERHLQLRKLVTRSAAPAEPVNPGAVQMGLLAARRR
jgi:hypothetical protein